ncbi:helix-turn-helix domain-containing protein [uncultured Friedmanniella sp.]|uniref:helix-turn-helix domain-containing protein n=1 Tax=uncultured Friedmanniella sp. TaxID=335381 RepID=UPI0035CC703F
MEGDTDLWTTPAPAELPAPLRPFVGSVAGYGGAGLMPGVHRGLPGRSLTLVLAPDEPLGVAVTSADWAAGRVQHQHVTLSGLHTEPAFVAQPGRWSGVQVDVSPLGAHRLFDVPAGALPTDGFDGRAILGADADRVCEELAGAATWPDRYAVVLGWLLARLRAGAPGRVRTEVVRAWRLLEVRGGSASVAEVAEAVGVGPRRLAQLFRAELGVTPKVAARLMRFEAARREVALAARAPGPLGLSAVAVRHGYYDHAHLVREFTAFTGLSPTGWVAAEVANVQAP